MKKLLLVIVVLLCISCSKDDNPLISDDIKIENAITAFYQWDQFKIFLGENSESFSFISVATDIIGTDGKAKKWDITIFSRKENVIYKIKRTKETIEVVAVLSVIDGAGYFDDLEMNSDRALELAEKNGGQKFRADNNNTSIKASLSLPVIPNAKTAWTIFYKSGDKYFTISIDVKTSDILSKNTNA